MAAQLGMSLLRLCCVSRHVSASLAAKQPTFEGLMRFQKLSLDRCTGWYSACWNVVHPPVEGLRFFPDHSHVKMACFLFPDMLGIY